MTVGPILIVIVFLLLVGALPTWPYARKWGYRPTIVLAIILALIVIFIALNPG